MTAEERERFRKAVAEEQQGRAENVAAAKELLPALLRDCEAAVAIIANLRHAREAAGVSLAEMEARTGIRKSALSRFENSRAPNPTCRDSSDQGGRRLYSYTARECGRPPPKIQRPR